MHKHLLTVLAVVMVALAATIVHADNAKLMEKEAERLVRINNEVLKELELKGTTGTVTISADVVRRDGKMNIRLERIETIPSPSAQTQELPQPPATGVAQGGDAMEKQVGESRDTLMQLLDEHPDALIIKLTPEEIRKIERCQNLTPSGGLIAVW